MREKATAEYIIDYCINNICTNYFWDECKEMVRAMYMTACNLEDCEVDTEKSDEWLNRIANCFDDWIDNKAFLENFENYMIEFLV